MVGSWLLLTTLGVNDALAHSHLSRTITCPQIRPSLSMILTSRLFYTRR